MYNEPTWQSRQRQRRSKDDIAKEFLMLSTSRLVEVFRRRKEGNTRRGEDASRCDSPVYYVYSGNEYDLIVVTISFCNKVKSNLVLTPSFHSY